MSQKFDPQKEGFLPQGDPALKVGSAERLLACGEVNMLLDKMKAREELSEGDFWAVTEHLRSCKTQESHSRFNENK